MKIMIVGGGDYIKFITSSLISRGYKVVIVIKDETECRLLSQTSTAMVVQGDGTDPRVLEDAGISEIDSILAITPHDEDNFLICKLALYRYNVRSSFALVYDPDNAEVFQHLGIKGTFSVSEILAQLIEVRTSSESIRNLQPLAQGKINLTEVELPEGSPLLEKQLKACRLPRGTLIVSIARDSEVQIPDGESTFQIGDIVSFISLPQTYAQALRSILGKEALS